MRYFSYSLYFGESFSFRSVYIYVIPLHFKRRGGTFNGKAHEIKCYGEIEMR